MKTIKPLLSPNKQIIRFDIEDKPYKFFFTEESIKKMYEDFNKSNPDFTDNNWLLTEDQDGFPKGTWMIYSEYNSITIQE